MNSTRRIAITIVATTLLSIALASSALAQSSGPIQVIVPYAPGGSADILGRLFSDLLGKQINRPVLVVNQPGAGGELGTINVSKAKPDGNTLLFQAPAVTIVQTLRKNPTFDVRRDLVPIALTVESSMGFYVNPEVPVHNIRELITYAKANPGKLNYASSGMGSSAHLYTELFKTSAGVDIVHIPYSGGSAFSSSVVKNEAQVLIADSLGSPRPQAAAGRLRMLAVGSAARSPAFPDVPTVSESGLPGYEVSYWLGFFAPPGTPADIVEKLNASIMTILKTPAVRDRLVGQGYAVIASSSADFKTFIAKEVAKWEKLVRDANIPKD